MQDTGVCGDEYDNHRWEWIDSRHTCAVCGLVDLDGERIMQEVAARLEVPRSELRK